MSHVVVAELVANALPLEGETDRSIQPADAVVALESMRMEIPVLADAARAFAEIVVATGGVGRDSDPLLAVKTA